MNTPSESFTVCYKCKSTNPSDKKFCGDCGTPLDPTIGAINAYLDANLTSRLDEVIKTRFREQQVIEIELAAKVAEKVSGWTKLFAILVGLPLTIMGAYLAFVGFDY